jgi:hypothetical protein
MEVVEVEGELQFLRACGDARGEIDGLMGKLSVEIR